MEQNNATIEVEHNGETIEVPETLTRNDYAAYFGSVPDEFEVERVFVYEGNVRAEAYLGDNEWVEAIYQTEDSRPVTNASELGWVVETIDAEPSDVTGHPGETVWVRDDEPETETLLVELEREYSESDPLENVAEAQVIRGDRRVSYIYRLDHESDTLVVDSKYYHSEELRNQSNTQQTFDVSDGEVQHSGFSYDLMQFIEDNAFADPEVSITDEFESMVEVGE